MVAKYVFDLTWSTTKKTNFNIIKYQTMKYYNNFQYVLCVCISCSFARSSHRICHLPMWYLWETANRYHSTHFHRFTAYIFDLPLFVVVVVALVVVAGRAHSICYLWHHAHQNHLDMAMESTVHMYSIHLLVPIHIFTQIDLRWASERRAHWRK